MFDSDVNYWSKSIPSMFYLIQIFMRHLSSECVCAWAHGQVRELYLWRNRDFRAETKQEPCAAAVMDTA